MASRCASARSSQSSTSPRRARTPTNWRGDFGSETLQSAAGLTAYDEEELLGRQVLAVVNLGTVSIAGFESQCLVCGVDGQQGVVHLGPEREVENGQRAY